jgi:hypothetical protein
MTDYRNMDPDFHNPEDPFRRDPALSPDAGASNAMWGWVAAAVFIVAVLAVGFGIWGKPQSNGMNTASNDQTAPAVTRMAPPAPMPTPTMAPTPPAPPSAPVTPAPSAPGPAGNLR